MGKQSDSVLHRTRGEEISKTVEVLASMLREPCDMSSADVNRYPCHREYMRDYSSSGNGSEIGNALDKRLTNREIMNAARRCFRNGRADIEIYRETKLELSRRYPERRVIPFQVANALRAMGVSVERTF